MTTYQCIQCSKLSTDADFLVDKDPQSPEYGQPIYFIDPRFYPVDLRLPLCGPYCSLAWYQNYILKKAPSNS